VGGGPLRSRPQPFASNKEAGDLASKIVGEKVRIMPTDRSASTLWQLGRTAPTHLQAAEPQALKSDIVHESAHLLVSKARAASRSGHGADFRQHTSI